MLKGYWNNIEPITFVPISYEVAAVKQTPLHWQNSHVGERRQALMITAVKSKLRQAEETFVIDNQHGDGYYKIFSMRGCLPAGHKSVVNPQNISELPDEDIITKYDHEALMNEEKLHDDYGMEVDPETQKKVNAIKGQIGRNQKKRI